MKNRLANQIKSYIDYCKQNSLKANDFKNLTAYCNKVKKEL